MSLRRRSAITLMAVLLWAWPNDSRAQYDPEKWPQFTLRFSEAGTLKDVFDSGLRPYRFPSLERSLLEVKHVRVTIAQRNGETLPEFPAQLVEVTPLEGGLLSSMEFTRYKTTLEEARRIILPYLAKGGRTGQELDRFLAAVSADYLDYNGMGKGVEDFGVSWSEPGGPRYVVGFRKAFDEKRPLIFLMAVDWSQVRTSRQISSFYKEPIPPPPGYERESMQAPKKFGPDSQAEINLAKGISITGDRPPSALPRFTFRQWLLVVSWAVVRHRVAMWLGLAGALVLVLAVLLRRRSN